MTAYYMLMIGLGIAGYLIFLFALIVFLYDSLIKK